MKKILIAFILAPLMSCYSQKAEISEQEYFKLMNNIATGWSTQNTDLALNSFDEDAIYMEPPDIQYFRGHSQLRSYFDALTEKHQMTFHNLFFNEQTQKGGGEFTFSFGKSTATSGTLIVELKNGKIIFWREYHRKGPADFNQFIQIENKNWKWHIGNYPEPKTALKNHYLNKAIKIFPDGEILQGVSDITVYWDSLNWNIESTSIIKNVVANKSKIYEYEINNFTTSDGELFKQLVIWNVKDGNKKIELEFTAKAAQHDSNKLAIDIRRSTWIALCNKHNAENLVHELYAPNAIYYNHKPPIVGRPLITKEYGYMNNEKYQLSLEPIHLEEVNENLALEIGQCIGSYNGKYVIIWQKNESGKWFVLMDSNI